MMRVIIACFGLHLLSVYRVTATDYFCSDDGIDIKIQGEITGRIITLQQGETYYKNNMKCSWTLETDQENQIQIRVESSNLQWSPFESICEGYDGVDIKEGENLLVSWCGEKFPKVINSRGNRLQIIFETDASNPPSYSFRGARIVFEVFNKLSCPPNWETYEDFCYSKGYHSEGIWSSTQIWCNHGQANLVSVTTDKEFDFISKTFLNNSQDEFYWIGLNDISSPGNFKWIDNTVPKDLARMPLPQPATFYHCSALRVADKRLMMKDCERDKFQSLCKASRTNLTKLYLLPTAETNKGDKEESSTGRNLLLGILLPAVALLVIVIICVIVYKLCCENRRRVPRSAPNPEPALQCLEVVERRPSQSRSVEPSAPSAPPSYDEALNDQTVKW